MERPGPLFVYENTVEHTSWGPPVAAQNLRCINKEKGFSPGGFEKRLHGMTNLTGSISEKWGRGIFFFCLSSYTGLPKGRVILLKAGKNQTRPCAAICGRSGDWVGERHHRSSKPALLEACEPVLNEQSRPDQPKKDDTQPLPL